MSNNEQQQLREMAPMIDVKSFKAGLNYAQGIIKAVIDKTAGEQTKARITALTKEHDALIPESNVQFIVNLVMVVNETALTALGEVLERDSKWAVDKLIQYSEGVSDAHVSKLAAAMKGQYQNHNLAPRKNGSAADDDTK